MVLVVELTAGFVISHHTWRETALVMEAEVLPRDCWTLEVGHKKHLTTPCSLPSSVNYMERVTNAHATELEIH